MGSDGGAKWLICCYLLSSVLLQASGYSLDFYGDSSLSRIRRAPKKCNGFRCVTSGKCIKSDKRCDGKVDCQDGSDEFNDCKNVIDCPGYLFTCDYGACIEKDNVCDGKKDCRDNSDEAHCIHQSEKVSSNCKSNQFECNSGQCISLDDKCNGIADCSDRSDETKETCLNMNCPGFTFVCDYGACVDGFAECNGVKDCIDNSDEDGCANETVVTPTTKPKPPPVVVVPTDAGGCLLPNYPDNGRWIIQGGAKANPGDRVGFSTLLTFACDNQYKLSSENSLMACLDGGWSTTPPTCKRLCSTLYTTEITKVTCFDENKAVIKCDSASDGSSATFECAPYYEAADRSSGIRYCWDGAWNLPPPQCVPVCGEKRVSAEPFIVNGHNVAKGDYPWVAAVYQKVPGDFQNVCGGSMLTQRVIITAAHCVTNEFGEGINAANVKVAVGKYYNAYKDPNDTQAQYSDVSKILVHSKYRGESQRFASDIAFLITKDRLLLSKVVQPVCYHDLPHIHLSTRMEGVITGWGFTQPNGSPSNELKEIPVPYKDDATCITELPKEWTDRYFTYDKMCAGHYNKSVSVCKGDSGGGLVFPKDGRYFIMGLVSVGQWTEQNGCDIQISSLYTKVSMHYDWLEQVTSQYNK